MEIVLDLQMVLKSEAQELDALVAEYIMGWKWSRYIWWDNSTKYVLRGDADHWELRGDDFGRLDDTRLVFWDMPQFSQSIDVVYNAESIVIEKCKFNKDAYLNALNFVISLQRNYDPTNPYNLIHADAESRARACLLTITDIRE